MPPKSAKKDDKKGKKGAAASVVKEIDHLEYIRKAVQLPDILDPRNDDDVLKGKLVNLDKLFPEWSINNENWAEAISAESSMEIKYPSHLAIASTTTLKAYLKLNPPEEVNEKGKKGGKKEKKSAKDPVATDMQEVFVTEDGIKLPVMFQGTIPRPSTADASAGQPPVTTTGEANEFLGYKAANPFFRYLSSAQLKVKTFQEKIRAKLEKIAVKEADAAAAREAATAATAGTNPQTGSAQPTKVDEEKAAKKKGDLQAALQRSIDAHGAELVPDGMEVDSFVCDAFSALMKFVPSFFAQPSTITDTVVAATTTTTTTTAATDGAVSEGGESLEYLWRSIYPKTPAGKPCYNSVGAKYAVRLFLAGKWRKVYVDDSVPLRADGICALASSREKMELWPMILSKAIYTVFSACGYSEILPSIQDTALADDNPEIAALNSSQFVAFALHLLTGWLPSHPLSLADTHSFSPTQCEQAIQRIVDGGAALISEDDIVDDYITDESGLPAEVLALPSSKNVPAIGANGELNDSLNAQQMLQSYVEFERKILDRVNPDGTPFLRTKAQFKEEYTKRKELRDAVLASIAERERKISVLNSSLNATAPSEVFLLTVPPANLNTMFPDTKSVGSDGRRLSGGGGGGGGIDFDDMSSVGGNTRPGTMAGGSTTGSTAVLPYGPAEDAEEKCEVLTARAVAFPKDYSGVGDIFRVKVLVEWVPGAPGDAVPIHPSLHTSPAAAKLNSPDGLDLSPIIPPTPLQYRWVSVGHLIRRRAALIGMDTLFTTPFSAALSRRWKPYGGGDATRPGTSNDKKAGKDKKAGAKGGKGAAVAPDAALAASGGADGDLGAPVCVRCDQGFIAPTFLSVDCSDLLAKYHRAAGNNRPKDKDGDGTSGVSAAGVASEGVDLAPSELPLDAEATEAVQAQERELAEAGGFRAPESVIESPKVTDGEEEMLPTSSSSSSSSPVAASPVETAGREVSLKLSITIHADTLFRSSDTPVAVETEGSAAENGVGGGAGDGSATSERYQSCFPDDIVVILQEFRLGSDEYSSSSGAAPLLLKMDMRKDLYLPIARKTFSIPASRLLTAALRRGMDPPSSSSSSASSVVVFWLRVFTKSSFHMHFHSNVNVSVGNAESIWASSIRKISSSSADEAVGNTAGSTTDTTHAEPTRSEYVIVQEGDAAPTRSFTENLFFRLPLQVQKAGNVAAFLHISDRAIARHVSLLLQQPFVSPVSLDTATTEADECLIPSSYTMPSLENNVFVLSAPVAATTATLGGEVSDGAGAASNINAPKHVPNKTTPSSIATLLGRVFPLLDGGDHTVSSFHWKLVVLAAPSAPFAPESLALSLPLNGAAGGAAAVVSTGGADTNTSPSPLSLPPVSQRFCGRYVANNKLLLFRDVYSVDMTTFPLSLRLSLSDVSPGQKGEIGVAERTWLSLKVFPKPRKPADSAPVAAASGTEAEASTAKTFLLEYFGRGLLPCYSIPLDLFRSPDAAPPASSAADKGKGGKQQQQAKKGAAGAGASGDEGAVELIVECSLDPTAMEIPASWWSKFPHAFNDGPALQKSSDEQAVDAVGGSDSTPALRLATPSIDDSPFAWSMDILSGKVVKVCHDTSELEAHAAAKNAWEFPNGTSAPGNGRAERAAAALAFYREKKRRDQLLSTSSSSSSIAAAKEESETLKTKMVDLMVESFAGTPNSENVDLFRERYTFLHSLAKFEEFVDARPETDEDIAIVRPGDPIFYYADPAASPSQEAVSESKREVGESAVPGDESDAGAGAAAAAGPSSTDADAAARAETKPLTREEEKVHSEEAFVQISERFKQFNLALREGVQQRMTDLIAAAKEDYCAMSELWPAREAYREDIAKKNASLASLLGSAQEAKQAAWDKENGVDDKKKGKKGKKGK